MVDCHHNSLLWCGIFYPELELSLGLKIEKATQMSGLLLF